MIAHNTAVTSDNRIHDDEVARRFGFRGGLVPGVDVYAYMTRPMVEAWGTDWLESGSVAVRFLVPVYDGDPTRIEPAVLDADTASVRVIDPAGTECAVATFIRHHLDPTPPADGWATATRPDHRPPASPQALAAYGEGGAFPTLHLVLTPDDAATYLDDAREELAVYHDEGIAHPGWLLRRANDALVAAVQLGPWIHVGSTVRHHGVIAVGETVEVRARLVRWWEAGGHRFVNLDVAIVVDGGVRATVDHTAIYEPRSS